MFTRRKTKKFLIAAKKLGINPADCVVIEDSDAGIQAAKNGGMKAVAVGAAVNNQMADYRAAALDKWDYENNEMFN